MKAKDLREALNALEPNRPLATEAELRDLFVSRPDTPLKRLRVMLDNTRDPQKILFTGHRGCGKSTELAKLVEELDDRFFVLSYSVRDSLNTYDLTHVDVLLALGLGMYSKAVTDRIPLPDTLLQRMLEFTKEITETTEASREATVGGEIKTIAGNLTARLKVEDKTRKEVRDKAGPRLSALLDRVDVLSKAIEAETQRRVLVIIEDLDKVDLETAKKLFYDHASSLGAPRVSIIYTFPIALRHAQEFSQVRMSFPTLHVLPIFKIATRDGEQCHEAFGVFCEILLRRLERHLLEPGVIELLSRASGGIPRELVALAQQSCLEAMAGDRQTIDIASVQEAIKSVRRTFEVLLSKQQIALLGNIHRTKQIDNDDRHRELLHNLSCLEYRNEDVWYDAHPVVIPLLGLPDH